MNDTNQPITPEPVSINETNQPITQYPVSIWEGIAIASGAVLLVITGVAGLGYKMVRNAFAPQRAEAIAQNLMKFKIPGGSQGAFGLTLGGATIAVVTSKNSLNNQPGAIPYSSDRPPVVELIIAKTPPDRESKDNPPQNFNPAFSFSGLSFSYQSDNGFQATSSRSENKLFCGEAIPVLIQEGRQTFANKPNSVPAIKYSVRRSLDDHQRLVVVTAIGEQAQKKAATVFNSLKCQ
ncbi:MAG: hypothetical protein WBG73_03910 [Coleofasciculaceae cyanobacterium]